MPVIIELPSRSRSDHFCPGPDIGGASIDIEGCADIAGAWSPCLRLILTRVVRSGPDLQGPRIEQIGAAGCLGRTRQTKET
eukprot:7156203-Pyramimonas_sp.AAC.1